MKKNSKWIIIIASLVVVIAIGGYIAYQMSTSNSNKNQSPTVTVNNEIIITKTNSSIGDYLADPSGNALYTYGSDTTGISNCMDTCLSTWPAYLDNGTTTGLPTGIGTIQRTDNSKMQYTYNGMPLYYFASDSNGQVTGNGINNFQVAKPSSAVTSPSTVTPSSNSNTQSSPSYSY